MNTRKYTKYLTTSIKGKNKYRINLQNNKNGI